MLLWIKYSLLNIEFRVHLRFRVDIGEILRCQKMLNTEHPFLPCPIHVTFYMSGMGDGKIPNHVFNDVINIWTYTFSKLILIGFVPYHDISVAGQKLRCVQIFKAGHLISPWPRVAIYFGDESIRRFFRWAHNSVRCQIVTTHYNGFGK